MYLYQGWAVEHEFKLEKADQSKPTEVVDDGTVAKDSIQVAKVPSIPTSAKKKVALQLNSLLRYTNCETYNLTFETDDLIALSRSIKNWVKTEIATYAGTVCPPTYSSISTNVIIHMASIFVKSSGYC